MSASCAWLRLAFLVAAAWSSACNGGDAASLDATAVADADVAAADAMSDDAVIADARAPDARTSDSALRFDRAEDDHGAVEVGGVASHHVVTVSNPTTREIADITAMVTGEGFTIFTTTCTGKLAAHASCTVTIAFAPTATRGFEGSLWLVHGVEAAILRLAGSGQHLRPTVTIVSAGTSAGYVRWDVEPIGGSGFCVARQCALPFASGATVTLEVRTSSRFAGWSGACAGEVETCTITVSDDVTVTATFAPVDAEEVWARMGAHVQSVTFDRAGHLIAAGGRTIRKLDSDGGIHWSVALAGATSIGLETDTAGDTFSAITYDRDELSLVKISSDGVPLWSRVVVMRAGAVDAFYGDRIAVTPSGDVALGVGLVRLYQGGGTGAGTLRWTAATPRGARAVAATPSGEVLVAVEDEVSPEDTQIWSIDAAGQPSLLSYRVYGADGMLAVDDHGVLLTSFFGFLTQNIQYWIPGGLSLSEDTVGHDEAGVGVDLEHRVVVLTTLPPDGLRLRQYDATAKLRWELRKPRVPVPGAPGWFSSIYPYGLAVSGDGAIAAIGDWRRDTDLAFWMAVYRPPTTAAATARPGTAPRAAR